MTEETIKKLDDLATKEVKRLGINVRRHEFFISSGDYPKKMDRDVFRIRPREVLHVLTDGSEGMDGGFFQNLSILKDACCFMIPLASGRTRKKWR